MASTVRPSALAAFLMAAVSVIAAGELHAQGDEVPFITTPDNITLAMLEVAKVGKNDFVIDLGSGDGRIVIAAAKRFGARGLGVELVADLVRQSRENAKKVGVADRAKFVEMDLFKADLTPATVITMYLLPEVNLQLRPRLLCLKSGTRIVSHDWDMGDWLPEKMLTLPAPDKTIGLKKESKVYLWHVPPRAPGERCSRLPTTKATMKKPG